jgi:hypothetical protein
MFTFRGALAARCAGAHGAGVRPSPRLNGQYQGAVQRLILLLLTQDGPWALRMTGAQAMALIGGLSGRVFPAGPRYETVMTAKQDLAAGAPPARACSATGTLVPGLPGAPGTTMKIKKITWDGSWA